MPAEGTSTKQLVPPAAGQLNRGGCGHEFPTARGPGIPAPAGRAAPGKQKTARGTAAGPTAPTAAPGRAASARSRKHSGAALERERRLEPGSCPRPAAALGASERGGPRLAGGSGEVPRGHRARPAPSRPPQRSGASRGSWRAGGPVLHFPWRSAGRCSRSSARRWSGVGSGRARVAGAMRRRGAGQRAVPCVFVTEVKEEPSAKRERQNCTQCSR
ncbi:uncharacterized protein [Patagioenas fasciata]|uniref:uncharacterized protein n=1 Tax=Patagioenas fasciata TaxID=372321 RepID=UPI003A990B85